MPAPAAATLAPAYVAGRGAVSCFGRGRQALADAIFSGALGVLPRARTAAWDAPTEVAAEFPADLFAELGGGPDLALQAALAAAWEALDEGAPRGGATALVLASTKGDLSGVLAGDAGEGLGLPGRLAERLARELGIGPLLGAVSCACASGVVALATAARHLHAGTAERVLVVGVDVLHPFVLAGFGSLHALDHKACRPFDAARRGVSLGEAAAALLLSRRPEDSLGAVLVGHGGANDACHVTGPDRQGAGIALAAARAIAGAGLQPADIDLLHLHGTATIANDATEAIGLGALFGGRTPPAFGTKGQTGHSLGASGVLETILTIEALQRRTAPANAGLECPDVDPALTLVRRGQRLERSRHGLKVASGFGGVQAAVVVGA